MRATTSVLSSNLNLYCTVLRRNQSSALAVLRTDSLENSILLTYWEVYHEKKWSEMW